MTIFPIPERGTDREPSSQSLAWVDAALVDRYTARGGGGQGQQKIRAGFRRQLCQVLSPSEAMRCDGYRTGAGRAGGDKRQPQKPSNHCTSQSHSQSQSLALAPTPVLAGGRLGAINRTVTTQLEPRMPPS
jgi:hypothetical protein